MWSRTITSLKPLYKQTNGVFSILTLYSYEMFPNMPFMHLQMKTDLNTSIKVKVNKSIKGK